MQRKRIVTMLTTGILMLSICIPTFAQTTTDYQTLKDALNEAQATYENATNEKEEARIAFEEQESNTDPALDSVRDLTGEELSNTIDSLKEEAKEAKDNYALAVVPYNESLDTLNGGAFSFFKWVAENYPGYADDANNAIAVLEKAQSMGYITDVVYSEDQTSFYSMKVAERYMEDYVTLRAYLGIEYVPMTNLTAVADSMMSVGGAKTYQTHFSSWLMVRGWDENLSFGYYIYDNYGKVYNGELAEIYGYTPDQTIGEEMIDLVEMNGDVELVDTEAVPDTADTSLQSPEPDTTTQPVTEDITTTENTEETTTIGSSEELTEEVTETTIEDTDTKQPSSETEDTVTEASTEENATEESSEPEETTEPEGTTEGIVAEDTTEGTEDNLINAISEDTSSEETSSEEETTTEVTYPTFEEWYAEEVANGMLDACPFLSKSTPRSPFAGWYTYEKYNYDLIKKYNYNNGGQVGHYYNLTRKRNSEIYAMAMKGSTFVLDMKTYYATSGSPTNELSAGIGYCTNYATMSVSEYNSLLDAFYNSLNLSSQKDAIEGYKAEYQNAVTRLAYCKAKKTYEEKCTAFEEAKTVMEAAQNAVLAYAPYSPEVSLCNVSTGVKVSWDAVDTGKMYYVYRKTEDSDWAMAGMTKATTYVDRKAEDGTVYYYAVLTKNLQQKKSEYLFSNKKIMRVENVELKVYYNFYFDAYSYTDSYEKCPVKPVGTYDGDILFYREEDDGTLTQIDFCLDDFWPELGKRAVLSKENTVLNRSYTYYYKLVRNGYESTVDSIDITVMDGIQTVNQRKIGNATILSWKPIKMLDNQRVSYIVYRKFTYANGNTSSWSKYRTVSSTSCVSTVTNKNVVDVQYIVIPTVQGISANICTYIK